MWFAFGSTTCMSPQLACMVVVLANVCFQSQALAQMPEWRGAQTFDNTHSHFNDTHGNTSHGQSTLKISAPANVTAALMNSGRALKTLNSHVQAIQLQINAMQKADTATITKKGAEYERQLALQRAEIANAEARNAHKVTEIEHLREKNKGLRKNASILSEACRKVRLEIIQMQNNVTVAMEFMHKMLNESENLLNASDVQITKELDTQDLIMQKRLALAKSLNSFGMLQLSSERLVPAELVQGLVSTLEDYNKQKVAQENSLKLSFEHRFKDGGDQLVALQEDYQKLSATCQAETELKSKLKTAVQHLEKTFVRVTRQKQNLAKFFATLKDQSTAA